MTSQQHLERADPAARTAAQLARLTELIRKIHGPNRFYTRKLEEAGIRPGAFNPLTDLTKLPVTAKRELAADQVLSPPWGSAPTVLIERFTWYNRTSSSSWNALRWL